MRKKELEDNYNIVLEENELLENQLNSYRNKIELLEAENKKLTKLNDYYKNKIKTLEKQNFDFATVINFLTDVLDEDYKEPKILS